MNRVYFIDGVKAKIIQLSKYKISKQHFAIVGIKLIGASEPAVAQSSITVTKPKILIMQRHNFAKDILQHPIFIPLNEGDIILCPYMHLLRYLEYFNHNLSKAKAYFPAN